MCQLTSPVSERIPASWFAAPDPASCSPDLSSHPAETPPESEAAAQDDIEGKREIR